MITEVNRRYIKQFGTVEKAIAEGYCIDWSPERITNTFNFGNGSIKDMKRYMNDNKGICVFIND
jgi:hypothetical protein